MQHHPFFCYYCHIISIRYTSNYSIFLLSLFLSACLPIFPYLFTYLPFISLFTLLLFSSSMHFSLHLLPFFLAPLHCLISLHLTSPPHRLCNTSFSFLSLSPSINLSVYPCLSVYLSISFSLALTFFFFFPAPFQSSISHHPFVPHLT